MSKLIQLLFVELVLNQKFSFLRDANGQITKINISDEEFQQLYQVFYYSFNDLDEAIRKDESDPLQEQADEEIKLVAAAILSVRHYLQSALARPIDSWQEAAKILLKAFRKQSFTMHTMAPSDLTTCVECYLNDVQKPPYLDASNDINLGERHIEVRKALNKYQETMDQIHFNKLKLKKITGTEAAEKTFEVFMKLYVFVLGRTYISGTPDSYHLLFSSLNELIEKYNAKARANRTRSEKNRNKAKDNELPSDDEDIIDIDNPAEDEEPEDLDEI